jgi:hypothetical protein
VQQFDVSGARPLFANVSAPLKVAILATLIWVLTSAAFVGQNHQVPSMLEFKASRAEYVACGGNGSGQAGAGIQSCLEAAHGIMLQGWKRDVGNIVVIPPLLAWASFGIFNLIQMRRRKPA